LLSGPPGIGEYVFIVYYYSPWLRRSLTWFDWTEFT
jgi:hypothetical protein